ncbi:unnamed protein product [Adineta steineri]|uniref:HTH OST-type domain-containing protein n=1 Tax=Adineta steineri TaxID=433720 RepID=A0A814T7W6_9BILA|nr:unnamed protein product [Adineta steineri]
MTKDTSSQGYLDLKTELRSILISSQQGCTEHQLLKDYAEYNSRKEIPFRDMGYKTLLDLLSSMPDVARIDYNRTPLTIHGVADQSTAHIKKFVMTQKRKKTTRSSRGTVNRYNNSYSSYNRTNGSSTYSRNRPVKEYRSIFDFLKQTNLTNCLHINQDFLFLFDLISTLKFLELHVTNASLLIETLRQQIVASSDIQYWKNSHDCYKPPKAVTPVSSAQSTNQKDTERYNELLANRNILCNLLRTNDITGCSVQLESIENELQSLVEKMRLGASSQQQIRNVPLTPPPGFTTKNNNDQQQQQQSTVNKTDKLKDLMERCKTLINTILVLDDHVVIDENIIKYIQNNLPFINSGKISSNDTQLYKQYSELLQNLTFIVDDLRQKLPSGVNL